MKRRIFTSEERLELEKNPYNIALKIGLEHRTAANLLQQNFKIKQPDKVYSTDISYLIYRGGKRAYLSATKDLATKEIVTFNISRCLDLDATYGKFYDFLKNKNCKKTNCPFRPGLALYTSYLC